tara:strand:+ start:712 stop:1110 length:399 start_codon:yes stop_codon:yes gene_type:complete
MPDITVYSRGLDDDDEPIVTNVKIDHDDGERVTTIREGAHIKFKNARAILHGSPPIIAKVTRLEDHKISYLPATGRDSWIIINPQNIKYIAEVVDSIELAEEADFDRAQASTARPGAATPNPQGLWPGFSDL